jgi:hypothetical protein
MALVQRLRHLSLEKAGPHLPVECTYSVVLDLQGRRCLQIDTYGSAGRKVPGGKSQSMRFTPEAIAQLKSILESHFR